MITMQHFHSKQVNRSSSLMQYEDDGEIHKRSCSSCSTCDSALLHVDSGCERQQSPEDHEEEPALHQVAGPLTPPPSTSCYEQLIFECEDASNPVLMHAISRLRRAVQETGPSNIRTADAINALGLVRLHTQQKLLAARQCFEHALVIYEQEKCWNAMAVSCCDLGFCFEQLGDSHGALTLYQKAVVLWIEEVGLHEEHPRLESSQRCISRLQRT